MCAYNLRPIARSLVRDQVADAVRELLLSGALPPGAPAREIEIAEKLGVSRNPVREALIRLQEEGLLVSNGPQKGLRVLELDEPYLEEIYSLRALLEGYAAELAAKNRSLRHLADMKEIAREMGNASMRGDINTLVSLDSSFHQVSVTASGHKLLVEAWMRAQNQFRFATRFAVDAIYGIDGLDRAHLRLVDPIESGDSQLAGDYARRHVSGFFELYKTANAGPAGDVSVVSSRRRM
jgi:DNA-binding GntR family transcriptional regulator